LAPLGGQYQRLWTATAISNLGNGVLFAAMPLLAQTITKWPAAISAVTAATALPGLLVALHAGAVIDQLDRRRVMVAMDLARLAILLGFCVLVIGGNVPLVAVYVAAFLLGAGDVTFDGAARSVVPAIVPMERLDAANGRLAAATDTMDELAGPPTGVALFALAASAPFLFDAFTFAASAVLLTTITGSFRAARQQAVGSFRREIAEGLQFVRTSRSLRVLAAGTGLLAFFSLGNLSVLVLFVLSPKGLDLPRAGYGYLLMTLAIGGLAGSLGVERFTRRWDHVSVLSVAVALNGGAYALLAAAHGVVLAMIAMVVWGASVSAGMTVSIGMRQALTPDHLLGRVMSVFRVLVGLGGVTGAVLAGVIVDVVGLRASYVYSGLIQLALAPLFALALRRAGTTTAEET
jgi:MFS family permease